MEIDFRDYENKKEFQLVDYDKHYSAEEIDAIIRDRLDIKKFNTGYILDFVLDPRNFASEEVEWSDLNKYFKENNITLEKMKENGITVVKSYGGEDTASYKIIILKVIIDNKPYYIKYFGHYDSWAGVTWPKNKISNVILKEVTTFIFKEEK